MLRHYLQVAVRRLVSHRLYTFINVLGLSAALTCTVFVILFVRYQVSFDKWIPDTQRLYRVESTLRFPGKGAIHTAATPYALGLALRDQAPGITGVTRLTPASLTLTHGSRQILQRYVDFVDPDFFMLIRLPFIEGSPRAALSQPESVVLSESAAKQYFGNADPIGRTLSADAESCSSDQTSCPGDTVALRVTGIVRDLPQNTQLTGNVFIPSTSLADPSRSSQVNLNWFHVSPLTYITLAPGVTPAAILAAMPPILNQDVAQSVRHLGIPWRGSRAFGIHLTPFTHVHLSTSPWRGSLTPGGSSNTVHGVIIIGILILLVACVNFANLATARAALRAGEIGLRKTLGATRGQLMFQFLSEALFLALLSLICAAAVSEALLPAFNGFLHLSISLNYATDWRLDLILIGVSMAVGLVSGVYPALVLSRLRPVAALQAETARAERRIALRDALVLMQFAVSIALGIAVLVVSAQVNYVRNLKLGFRRNHIVVIHNRRLTGKREAAFVNALRAYPGVNQVGLSAFAPFSSAERVVGIQVPEHPSRLTLNYVPAGPNYPRVYGIALLAGRLLSASHSKDRFSNKDSNTGRNILVNAAGARRLGFRPRQTVGHTVLFNGTQVRIVGVVADAQTKGARHPVLPTVYAYYPDSAMDISLRVRSQHIPQTLAFIDHTWHSFVPTHAIQRTFLNDRFARLYRSVERGGMVFGVFVIIAIFIACLGLYGLVVFTADRRTKEVALRKISGARTLDILKIMLWRISMPVLLGNVIAWPVAYHYLHRWLAGFADHIWLNPAYFIVGGAVALVIAWATVFVHTLRLAHTSPVHALRYE